MLKYINLVMILLFTVHSCSSAASEDETSTTVTETNTTPPCQQESDGSSRNIEATSTTSGFKSVDVSPKLDALLEAIFRNIRLIILPDLVLGSPDTN